MYIEITQDGAGIMSVDSKESGLFTSDIQNCCVYIFKGKNAIAIVHDTGQLIVSSIKDISESCGKIEKITYAVNSNESNTFDSERHRERRNRILALTKWKKQIEKSM